MDEICKPVPAYDFFSDEGMSSVGRDITSEYTVFIEKLRPILSEMKDDKNLVGDLTIQKAIQSLEAEYMSARALSETLNSSPLKKIDEQTENLGRSLGFVLFASHDIPMARRSEVEALHKQVMNSRSNSYSERDSDFSYDLYYNLELLSNEIVEEDEEKQDRISLDVDSVVLQLKYGNDEDLEQALVGLNLLITESFVDVHHNDKEVISVLFNRLNSTTANNRSTIIRTLRSLVDQSNDIKKKMAEMRFLSSLVKSLFGDTNEQREAMRLLYTLSDILSVRRRLGRIRGCVVMLVAIFNGDDPVASHDAENLLNSLSINPEYVLNMAAAGYFKPLVHYLNEGSDTSKVQMATAISRMELTDKHRKSLGEDGAIEQLVKMFTKGNLESKYSALGALQNLSGLKENVKRLVNSGIISTLLQLLFSVTSVLMTLREPASAILAKIAQSEGGLLVKPDVAQKMLSLLNLTSPDIQCHLLEALNSIASHSNAYEVRVKMKQNGAIRLLLPFIGENNPKIRTGALSLINILYEDMQGEVTEQLDETHIHMIAKIFSSLSSSADEKASAVGILSNFPNVLISENLLPDLVSLIALTALPSNLAESIAKVLIRFTLPYDKKLQHFIVELGVIPALVNLLSCDSILAKRRAATCLAQLSQNSLSLRKSRKSKWSCRPPSIEGFCQVHNGYCSVKSTFCIVMAGAVTPLLQILERDERGADEAVLNCIATLMEDEIWENGCDYLVEKRGVKSLIKVLEVGSSKAKEKALWILEGVFRVEAYRVEHGVSAQPVLVDLAQNGNSKLKPIVRKLLAQL
ncbi:unnamed protein product [Cuscuta epithymum]|uniref:Armadillo repeat-containing domain-containing protein n=1 Tax=Cuscuta epithymum TaxID=186058 RepID=A0AAV0DDN2_9ASTE|nr:unnamed protein product [Cuscuta epithymum]